MRLSPPCEASKDTMTFNVREIEPLLQAPSLDLKPWPGAMVTLSDGRILYIREARLDEAPIMTEYMKKVLEVNHDFYDVVGTRMLAEIVGWYRKRIKDPYVLVGLIDGVWAGFANGRLMNEDINISLHTMTFMRGGRIGALMYYAKAYYAFELLGNKEWWATYESYNGWMRWGFGMAQPSYPWPEYQHELGGARVFYVTKEYWDVAVKKYIRQMTGTDLDFNVPDEIKNKNKTLIPLTDVQV
jgi:hypothetical protein